MKTCLIWRINSTAVNVKRTFLDTKNETVRLDRSACPHGGFRQNGERFFEYRSWATAPESMPFSHYPSNAARCQIGSKSQQKKQTPPLAHREKWGSLSVPLWCSLLFIQIGHVHQ
jgi:hypothetical protein